MSEQRETQEPSSSPAANLQKQTAKQFAAEHGISERQLYKFATVARLRPDLMKKVCAREMTVHAAWRETTGTPKPTSWDRLVTAWFNATYEERQRFIEQVAGWEEDAPAIILPDLTGTANLQSGAP